MEVEKAKNLFLDTSVFIYYMEEHPVYCKFINDIFNLVQKGDKIVHTSIVTLIEVLVKPISEGRYDLVDEYKDLLTNSKNLILHDILPAIAVKSAELRAKYKIRIPDAIQIASTIVYDGDVFITNDKRLNKVSEVPVMILDEVANI